MVRCVGTVREDGILVTLLEGRPTILCVSRSVFRSL